MTTVNGREQRRTAGNDGDGNGTSVYDTAGYKPPPYNYYYNG
jgi:hypothetical protein